jgi:hypothetical protein
MKYKLINNNTGQQFDCREIEIKGFKYYTIDTAVGCKYGISKLNEVVEIKINYDATLYKGIICTNNPNIDIPKVIDYVESLGRRYARSRVNGTTAWGSYADGYNKSQETHPFSEEKMIKFSEWYFRETFNTELGDDFKSTKELLQLWKEQQPKIVYYG